MLVLAEVVCFGDEAAGGKCPEAGLDLADGAGLHSTCCAFAAIQDDGEVPRGSTVDDHRIEICRRCLPSQL